MTGTDASLLDSMCALAVEAGAVILEIYARDFAVEHKADASPVTEADRRAEEIILRGLEKLAPQTPVLAEESAANGLIPELGEEFFLVDPLDGTKEFLSRNGEFTVNIALVRRGRPALGVVYAPALKALYAGGPGLGARIVDVGANGAQGPARPIAARSAPASGLVAVASRSHRSPETDVFLRTLKVDSFTAAGSSLKFCRLAEGAADVYPRLGRTMEWDTGAGHAVLEGAGGAVTVHPEGEPLRYGKRERGFDNPFFIAWGRRD